MLIKEPPVKIHVLKVRVTDHCGDFVSEILNITVVDFGPVSYLK
jgi:hypothetical protein